MSLQLAQIQKIYEQNRYNSTSLFLNPFSQILFSPSWVWPEEYAFLKKNNLKKFYSSGDSLKSNIKQWFEQLDIKEKKNCLRITDETFVEQFTKTVASYDPRKIYNMSSHLSMENYDQESFEDPSQKDFQLVIANLYIALTKTPIIYFGEGCDKFISQQLIKWLESVTNNKIFQFASKIKNRQQPEFNPLWFSDLSFHKLEAFFVNEIQKAIVKAYFNRDKISSEYLGNLKEFYQEFCQQSQKYYDSQLLNIPIKKVKNLSNKEFNRIIKMTKEIQDKYETQKDKIFLKILQVEENKQVKTKTKQSEKKDKKKRRRNKNKELQKQAHQKINQNRQIETSQRKPEKKQKISLQNTKSGKGQKKQQKKFVQEQSEDKYFITDQISHISKCQDSGLHETDVTIQKYLDIQDFELKTNENEENKNHRGQELFAKQQSIGSEHHKNEKIIQTINQSGNSSLNTTKKTKKKNKKQRQLQYFHKEFSKYLKNIAFTQFIDNVSIESNNLYHYKLTTYQFIVFFISTLLPTTNITLFGSNAVGLSLASSDIDIMISNNRWNNITQVRQVLYHVSNQIAKMGWVIDYKLILNAKVPVLKLYIDPKNEYFDFSPLKYHPENIVTESVIIKADIIVNIEGDQNIGCESTLLMKEWLDKYPQLQRIILFFKYVLWYYGLNENYTGGICSYCLFIMVVHCLLKIQQKDLGNFYNQDIKLVLDEEQEGSYILEILRFYCEDFETSSDLIYITKDFSKEPKQYCFGHKEQQPNNMKRALNLKIIDPINGEFIESSFSKFEQIRQLFSLMLVQIMKRDDKIQENFNQNIQLNEEFLKIINQIQNNFISKKDTSSRKSLEQVKMKKAIKKIHTKIKSRKNQTQQILNYNLKEIVGVGFRVGVESWMKSVPPSLIFNDKHNFT